ncbi:MAG: ATP-binding protein [Burkholderiaceae bacterium]
MTASLTPPRPLARRLPLLLAIASLAAGGLGAWWAYGLALSALQRSADDSLSLKQFALATAIERYRYLPRMVALDERVRAHLRGAGTPGAAAGAGAVETRAMAANRYLEQVNQTAGADALYLMDSHGLTIAASNWREPVSFVGRNYGFRPYFANAMAVGVAQYYAVGVTTGRPGFFLASRVDAGEGAYGVAVAKVDMSPLETAWMNADENTGVADRHGVIFLSAVPRWRYRPLAPLADAIRARLRAERTYDAADLGGEPLFDRSPFGTAGSDFSQVARVDGETYLFRFVRTPGEPWWVFTAMALAPVIRQAMLGGLLALSASAFLSVFLVFVGQRRQLVRTRLDAASQLEARVAERTEALAQANAALALEVDERRRAEQARRLAQDELVQAAKLAALGRMSAAIVHEVSQPLAAMENTLATAGLLLDRGDPGGARQGVSRARDLIGRMQRTVRHLKSFSRKESGQQAPVDVARCVDAALELLAHRVALAGVALGRRIDPTPARVMASATRLEQVFVNLIGNSLDALSGTAPDARRIDIELEVIADTITVRIRDSGPGVAEIDRGRVAEPFFTTKPSGEGLGLGLAISSAIVEDLGGRLVLIEPVAGRGCAFEVRLPVFVPSPRERTV